jgi:hypothetical protein
LLLLWWWLLLLLGVMRKHRLVLAWLWNFLQGVAGGQGQPLQPGSTSTCSSHGSCSSSPTSRHRGLPGRLLLLLLLLLVLPALC